MYRISMTGEPDKYVTLDNMCNNPDHDIVTGKQIGRAHV